MRKNNKCIGWLFFLLLCLCTSCGQKDENAVNLNEKLSAEISLLGHRNWIVITDMAYPLQNKPGIETVYTDDSFEDVLETVCKKIKKSPHVYGHFYQDEELTVLTDELCPGIQDYRGVVKQFVPEDEISYLRHEKLLAKMDNVSRNYKVLVIKTKLTLPYTSLFIELDCKYWNAENQKMLEKTLREMK